MLLRIACLLCLLCGLAGQAAAHPAPYSFIDIRLDANGISGAVTIHDYDAAHELGIARPDALLDPSLANKARAPLIALLDDRLRIEGGASRLRPVWGAIETLPARRSLRLPFRIAGPDPASLTIGGRLFPYDSSHQTFVNLHADGRLTQWILNGGRPSARWFSGEPQGRQAMVRTFVQAGVHHIAHGPDHILFLFGLLLLGGSWRRLTAIVTAFTLGHSATLSLAATGMLRLPAAIVEPAIALSIILVGVDAWVVDRQRRTAEVPAHDLRIWMAGAFGLIHGFGFASVLMEFGLPQGALAWALAAFNVGVEIGQLLIVLAAILAAAAIRRVPPGRSLTGARAVRAASIAIIAGGLYWFVERTFFANA